MGIGNEAQEVYNVVKIKLEMINKKPDNILLLGFFYRAGDEVRTRDIQLGRLTLYQLSYSRKNKNMTVGRTGFEPVKVKPADLQSALVGRLSISPSKKF